MQSKFISRRAELLDEIAAVYAQKLEAAEMKAVAEFYRSPVGSRLIDAQPQIMQESIMAGQRWGQRIGREIEEEARRELKRRGVDLQGPASSFPARREPSSPRAQRTRGSSQGNDRGGAARPANCRHALLNLAQLSRCWPPPFAGMREP